MAESIPLAVEVDGYVVHPPGWMFVWAAAIAGFEWAIQECATVEFRAVVAAWLKENPGGWLHVTNPRGGT